MPHLKLILLYIFTALFFPIKTELWHLFLTRISACRKIAEHRLPRQRHLVQSKPAQVLLLMTNQNNHLYRIGQVYTNSPSPSHHLTWDDICLLVFVCVVFLFFFLHFVLQMDSNWGAHAGFSCSSWRPILAKTKNPKKVASVSCLHIKIGLFACDLGWQMLVLFFSTRTRFEK